MHNYEYFQPTFFKLSYSFLVDPSWGSKVLCKVCKSATDKYFMGIDIGIIQSSRLDAG